MSRTKKWKKMEMCRLERTSVILNEEDSRGNFLEYFKIEEAHIEEAKKHTPLYYAAMTGDQESLAKFLNSGEFKKDLSLDLFSYAMYLKSNITPLHIAASEGNIEIAQMLLNYGMNVNFEDHHHATPLHYAANVGDHKMLKMLLEAGGDCSIAVDISSNPATTKYSTGFTPLHLAAKYRHVECVKVLLQFGADCAAQDDLNRTCLFLAAEAGAEDCVLYLLRNAHCESFLSLPCSNKYSYTPLHLAVKHGMLECVKEMVRLGSDINYRDGEDMSPLHIICCNSSMRKSLRMEILKVLVLEGRNTDMNSAFHPSYFHEYTSEAKTFLIAYGASLNVRSSQIGLTFLEHELSFHLDRDLLKLVTKALPTLPHLQSLNIFPVIEDMPNKGTMWYSSVLPNDVTFSLVKGKKSMYVEMSSSLIQRSDSQSYFQTQLDTVINRPLKKLFLLQQPFLDLLYNHVCEKLKDENDISPEFDIYSLSSSTLNSLTKHQLLQLCHHLWYQKKASEPFSLMHHCRYSIRKCMGPSNVKHINKLPLPSSLKSYLLFYYTGYKQPFEEVMEIYNA